MTCASERGDPHLLPDSSQVRVISNLHGVRAKGPEMSMPRAIDNTRQEDTAGRNSRTKSRSSTVNSVINLSLRHTGVTTAP